MDFLFKYLIVLVSTCLTVYTESSSNQSHIVQYLTTQSNHTSIHVEIVQVST